jgi:hypothetical protein
VLNFVQKQPKQPRSPSPDHYQLLDSEFPVDGDLDLPGLDENIISQSDLFDFCYAEVEKELEGLTEVIDEDDANTLYGASAKVNIYKNIDH